jgi:hypothetical protein
MNQNHALTEEKVLPQPGPLEFMECSALIAKVVILNDDRFTEDDIATAERLVNYTWNANVTDFLYVIAGHNHPGESQDLAYAALVYRYDQ